MRVHFMTEFLTFFSFFLFGFTLTRAYQLPSCCLHFVMVVRCLVFLEVVHNTAGFICTVLKFGVKN